MCLDLTATSKVKTSKRNVICYKVLRVRDRGVMNSRIVFLSPHQDMKYQRDKRVEVKRFSNESLWTNKYFTTKLPGGVRTVDRGLHAYTSLARAKRQSSFCTRIIVECVIPAGTLFIEGARSEIVALALIPRKAVAGKRKAVEEFQRTNTASGTT